MIQRMAALAVLVGIVLVQSATAETPQGGGYEGMGHRWLVSTGDGWAQDSLTPAVQSVDEGTPTEVGGDECGYAGCKNPPAYCGKCGKYIRCYYHIGYCPHSR